jgi:2-polyprenyl-6-hydroxyphenyl methylase/3-demethylubiquinone-9 3-methyltransferase
VIGAEYLLQMLPRGTHEYSKFIKPSELDEWARRAQLQLCNLTGLSYNPLTKTYKLGSDIDVNYMAHYQHQE